MRVQRALPEALQDLRVLVGDDHPTARTILARYLEFFGFSTGEAASGAEAIDELERAEMEALTTELERSVAELIENLKSLIAAPDTAGVAPVQGEAPDLLPQLDQLRALLEDYDSEAADLASEIESQAANAGFARPLREYLLTKQVQPRGRAQPVLH